jgi:hypothetical protein
MGRGNWGMNGGKELGNFEIGKLRALGNFEIGKLGNRFKAVGFHTCLRVSSTS